MDARRLGLCLFFVLIGWAGASESAKQPAPPTVAARCALLMETSTGQVLYARNPDRPCPPASLTKIMTAILLLEHTQPDDVITASKRAAETPNSSMHLKVGEQVRVHDLLYAILLRSANDGCVAAAEHVAGSVEKFVQMMNQKAKELGASRTHFVNPHGLHHPRHVSTARDLALITRYALGNPLFNEVVKTYTYAIERSLNQEDLVMVNHAKFLLQYPYADGVKTGYTRQAGFCFIGSASHDGRRLIAVVLNSPKREEDTIALMEYGFRAWTPLWLGGAGEVVGEAEVGNGVQVTVPLALQRDALWVVPAHTKNEYRWEIETNPIKAPLSAGQIAGQAVLKRGAQVALRVPLVTAQAVEAKKTHWRWFAFGLSALVGGVWYYSRRRNGAGRGG